MRGRSLTALATMPPGPKTISVGDVREFEASTTVGDQFCDGWRSLTPVLFPRDDHRWTATGTDLRPRHPTTERVTAVSLGNLRRAVSGLLRSGRQQMLVFRRRMAACRRRSSGCPMSRVANGFALWKLSPLTAFCRWFHPVFRRTRVCSILSSAIAPVARIRGGALMSERIPPVSKTLRRRSKPSG